MTTSRLRKMLSWTKNIIKKFLKKRKKAAIITSSGILNSRKIFAKQIASTIKLNTNISKKESFILGLSGKWGEGKSTLLDDLAIELASEYRIVEINPWGVGTDQATFLRNFIKELNKQLQSEKMLVRFWHNILWKEQLNTMYFDINKVKISKLYAVTFILTVGFFAALYVSISPYLSFILPSPEDKTFVNKLIAIITISSAILTPIFLGIINHVFTTQRSSKAIATIDGFKDLLKKILKSTKNSKIVVFVDDLDRVTPEMARIVLDNLRVFFDEPRLSFVVTGDHSVLERYLGMQTLPNRTEPEQLEEGRRYLKKIFNVYWRIPLVIKSELQTFISHQVTLRQVNLNSIFDGNQLPILKSYLEKYFESNFRQIIRFLDTILFTFSLIKIQVEESQGDEKSYFEEMVKEPLLVVRILMIQELCSPLFEAIIKNNEVLFNLEYAVDKKDLGKVASIIEPLTLTTSQSVFINNFIQEEPRFFNDSVLRVKSLSPFLNLAADSSFGDARGSSPEDFVNKIQSGDVNQVKSSIIGSGQEKINSAYVAFQQKFDSTTEIQNKTNLLTTLLNALLSIPQEHISHSIFLTKLKDLDLSLFNSSGHIYKLNAYLVFWKWLDIQKQEDVEASYTGKFPFGNANDFNFTDLTNLSWFSTKMLCAWLKAYYTQDPINARNKISELLPKLPEEFVKEEMDSLSDVLVDGFINEGNISYRDMIAEILLKYTISGKSKLQTRLLQEIGRLNTDIWTWTENKISTIPDFFDRASLEQQIVNYLDAVAPNQVLLDAMNFASGKIISSQDNFWNKVLDKHLVNFIELVPNLMTQNLVGNFAPSTKIATKLFKSLLKEAKETMDEIKRNNILEYLKRRWIWRNLPDLPDVNRIKKWYEKESNESTKEKIKQLLENWSQLS